MRRFRFFWMVLATGLAVLLGLLTHRLPEVQRAEEHLVDLYHRIGPRPAPAREVVVVAIDAESLRRLGPWPWPDEQLARLCRHLMEGEPAALGLAIPGRPALQEAFPQLIQAQPMEMTPFGDHLFRLVSPRDPRWGIHWLERPAGTVRATRPFHQVADQQLPAFETLLLADFLRRPVGEKRGREATVAGRAVPLMPEGLMRISYAGPARTYPYLPAFRILDGEIEPELWAGRIVLVGPTAREVDPGVVTPSTELLPMPRVEVSGHVIDTVLNGRVSRPAGATELIGLLLTVALFVGLLFRQLAPLGGVVLLLGCLLLVPVATFYAFTAAGLHVPLLPFWVLLPILYLYLSFVRLRELDGELDGMIDELQRLDKGFYVSLSEETESGYWQRALSLASMFLEARGFLLFVLPAESWHLELLGSSGEGAEAVGERRRDVRRAPWADARDDQPAVVDTFMKRELRVSSSLVPVRAVNRLLGFLVVNVPLGREELLADQKSIIRFISQQLATLLSRRRLSTRAPRRRQLLRWLGFDRLRYKLDQLAGASMALVEKKNLLYSLINSVDEGVIICDIFGRVLFYNAQIAGISETLGTTIQGKNVIDLIHDLGGLERSRIIEHFRRIVVTGKRLFLDIAPRTDSAQHFRLTLGAIRGRQPGPREAEGGGPILGLVCLFTDVTELKELDTVKSNLLQLISYRVLNVLTSIQGYSELLAESEEVPEAEREFATIIHEQSQELERVFDNFAGYADADQGLQPSGLRVMPLDLVEVLKETFHEESTRFSDRLHTLDLEAPERFDIVAADQALIREALRGLFAFLVENARTGSPLRVRLCPEDRFLRMELENQGFGVPHALMPFLFQEELPGQRSAGRNADKDGDGPPTLSRVKQIAQLHGGSVSATSAIGEGVTFSLWLPMFMKGSPTITKGGGIERSDRR